MPVQVAGPQAVQFFVADGKYREQVFSLEDMHVMGVFRFT